MLTKELDTCAAPNAWYAARDARMKSYAASTHYTQAERTRAERMRLGLELVYAAKSIYVTFRQKFVTVKVDRALVRDRKALAVLEAEYALEGITKAVTAQGVIYRIAKA
ncbi:MAG: hypothetical protein ACKOPD_06195 [Polynucleobacter victoriensis]